jgi:hypothetical protein
MQPHTAVKVNRNTVGTVIEKWWTAGYAYDQKTYKLVDLVETAPISGNRWSFIRGGYTHSKTHLHRDGVEGGHVLLLPFASKRFDLDDQKK